MRYEICMTRLFCCTVFYAFALFAMPASASNVGKEGFNGVKQCVMRNDAAFCDKVITDSSKPLFERFASHKLMPCLPTNFSYVSEKKAGGYTIVKATMPTPNNKHHNLHLAFTNQSGEVKLDVPESLRMGLGEKWQNKIQLAEQLYLLLQANAGGNLKCDQLAGLIKK